MRFWRRALAVVVIVLAPFLVTWAASAGSVPHVDGVVEGRDAERRLLVVFGVHLGKVSHVNLSTTTGEFIAELRPVHRRNELVLLELPADPPAGEQVLEYIWASGSDRTRVSLSSDRADPAPAPETCDCPTGPFLRLTGGDTVTGTVRFTTPGEAIVASSETAGAPLIESTAPHGTAIAGHGDIGLLGDVDSDGDYGVCGRCSGAGQVGVFGTADSYAGIAVYGQSWAYKGVAVKGRTLCGVGVYGLAQESIYDCSNYGEGSNGNGAAAVKAVSKVSYSSALVAEAQGSHSTGLLVNHTGGSGDLAVFRTGGSNCARIALDGTGYFNGGTFNSGADFAESVAMDAPAGEFEPGDVIAIDPASARRFSLCRTANSPLVAGVVSTRPAVVGTVHDMAAAGRAALADEVRVGIVGIVPTKVCDEGGAIAIGDLLVSATLPGHAKRAPEHPAPGTVVGKALGPLAKGAGKVEVLLMQR